MDDPSFRAIQLLTSLPHDFGSVARETLCGLLAVQGQDYLVTLEYRARRIDSHNCWSNLLLESQRPHKFCQKSSAKMARLRIGICVSRLHVGLRDTGSRSSNAKSSDSTPNRWEWLAIPWWGLSSIKKRPFAWHVKLKAKSLVIAYKRKLYSSRAFAYSTRRYVFLTARNWVR